MSYFCVFRMWQAGLRFGADDNESFESWLQRQQKIWQEEGGYGSGWGISGSSSSQHGTGAGLHGGSSGSGSSGYGVNGFSQSQTQITQSSSHTLHSASVSTQ